MHTKGQVQGVQGSTGVNHPCKLDNELSDRVTTKLMHNMRHFLCDSNREGNLIRSRHLETGGLDKSHTQDTVTAVAIIAAVAVWGPIPIAVAIGAPPVVSKSRAAGVIVAGPIMGCRLVTGAGVVWLDCPVVFPRTS